MYVGSQFAASFHTTCRNDDAGAAARPAPDGNLKMPRREIKKIAGAVDGELRTLKGLRTYTRDVRKLDGILGRLNNHDERLAALQSAGLDTITPMPFFSRSAASTALIALYCVMLPGFLHYSWK